MKEIIRRVRFAPYRKGMGPTFTLTLWDTGERKSPNHWRVGYRLTMHEPARSVQTLASLDDHAPAKRTVLFEGEDFGVPCHQSIDSDEAVEGIMAFLTLKPGDTDQEYFEGYTEEQLAYCSQHAEALDCEVDCRFRKDRQ